MHLLYPLSLAFLFLCNLATPTGIHGDIYLNCGGIGASAARNGREWTGDGKSRLSSSIQIKGSPIASGLIRSLSPRYDHVPYGTARVSKSRFSYEFRVNPGEKIVRLHFNSAAYKGFSRSKDCFSVESGALTLLSNFSASLTADALGAKSFVKEFCIKVEENQLLNLIFTPASTRLFGTYAFVNGIEIISVPSDRSYFDAENDGKSLVYVDNSTAFEIMSRFNFRKDSASPVVNDFSVLFGMTETIVRQKENKINSVTWRVSVDVGFRYSVRLYFSMIRFQRQKDDDFKICINETVASSNTDLVRRRNGEDSSIVWHEDFMVMINGYKQEGKRDILIHLETSNEFTDGHGPLEGFEVLKLSNPDDSLASPSPATAAQDLTNQNIRNLLQVLGQKNVVTFFAIALFSGLNIIICFLRKIREGGGAEKNNRPLIRAERLCRIFSLAEIQLATGNFSNSNCIGRGGFGHVYKGFIDNGQQIVAIKRLKSDSRQGVLEFSTEIETLTLVRHNNLVSLIGYCNERGEMILVYEYVAGGTLAHHLFKPTRDSDNHSSLTWRERLNICIGAGRGLNYLHSGCSLIHRDVKATNILLDEDFQPKVSDFGLAKYLSRDNSHVSTKVKGTFGYMDPSYVNTEKLTVKSDVYSFGVVLLEVLSERRALGEERILTMWAQENISQGNVEQIVASNLRGEISVESLKTFVEVAERCLHKEPKKRPSMSKVVPQLELALEQQEGSEFPLPNGTTHPMDVESYVGRDKELYVQETDLSLNGHTYSQEVYPVPRLRSWPWKRQQRRATDEIDIAVFSPLIKPKDMCFLVRKDKLRSLTMIGQGRYGHVYKAVLPATGKPIAIKKISLFSIDAKDLQGEEEKCLTRKLRLIRSEIRAMGQINHPNFVPLLAHLYTPDCHYLVYEYMENGSLNDCLQTVTGRAKLDWLVRYKIALAVAAGLEYLHMCHSPRILHGGLKPTNILLDDVMEARIADFGHTEDVSNALTHVRNTNVVGTVEYIAPEYFQTLKFSDKCDMYSFGVVLGVLVTGKLPHDEFFLHTVEGNMVIWMRNVVGSEDPKRAIDPKLLGNPYETQMVLFLKIACLCTMEDPDERPNSKEVRCMLTQTMDVDCAWQPAWHTS